MRTQNQLQTELEALQDEVEDLREEKKSLLAELNEKDYTGSVGRLREHIRTLEGLLGKKCENCEELKKENQRLTRENSVISGRRHGSPSQHSP
jgi:predicted RNase H-like nuclease (RuvC/YqgF family)